MWKAAAQSYPEASANSPSSFDLHQRQPLIQSQRQIKLRAASTLGQSAAMLWLALPSLPAAYVGLANPNPDHGPTGPLCRM